MKAQITIQITMNPELEVFPNAGWEESRKTCTYCGQSRIPFKNGICVCGNQVGDIQYVNSAEKFANVQYYSYVGTPNVDNLGIEELIDN